MHPTHRQPFGHLSIPTHPFIAALLAAIALGGCTEAAQHDKTVTLSWDAPTLNTDGTPLGALAGYHIYVGRDTHHLVLRGGITGTQSTSYVVTGLDSGTYCFAVRAYTFSGAESGNSTVFCKTL
jgi:hypothetical protein